MSQFLLEIRSEEIPARAQKSALQEIKTQLQNKLNEYRLSFNSIQSYVTPRRLIAVVAGIPGKTPEYTIETRGPRSDASPKAINGFLTNTGKTLADLEKRHTNKGEFYFNKKVIESQDTLKILPQIIDKIIKDFYWPQTMKWSNSLYSWIRPLTGGCAVFNQQAIKFTITLSKNDDIYEAIYLKFDDITRGHFILSNKEIKVNSFANYKQKLSEHYVIVDQEQRRSMIKQQIDDIFINKNLQILPDKGLLDEIVGLGEYPQCIMGNITSQFMQLPREILTTVMRVHQKYFTVTDQYNKIAPYFIVITNLKITENANNIRVGNEQVLKARLSDAQFFYTQDLKQNIQQRQEALKQIIFHDQLGSMSDKQVRLAQIINKLTLPDDLRENSLKAAQLCKTDLASQIVCEFPELQGIMGQYYMRDQANKQVAQAMTEQYLPRNIDDPLPVSNAGKILCIVDRLDTIVGFFMLGLCPTGSKDPFALRRAALGIIRILEANDIFIPQNIIKIIAEIYNQQLHNNIGKDINVTKMFFTFFLERLKIYWKKKDLDCNLIDLDSIDETVFALHNKKQKIQKLQNIVNKHPQFLVTYNRIKNIIKDKNIDNDNLDNSLLQLTTELSLYTCNQTIYASQESILVADFLQKINNFLDNVLIDDNNINTKNNRILLLQNSLKSLDYIINFC